jgi:autotransporter-associated beta strand protein
MQWKVALAAALAVAGLCGRAGAQTSYTWNTAVTSTAWLNSNNWTGNTGHFPGDTNNASATAEGTSADIAQIGNVNFGGNLLGINFNTSTNNGNGNNSGANGWLSLGAVVFNSGGVGGTPKDLTIGNSSISSTVTGELRLNGATVDGVANTLVAVVGSNDLTLAPTAGGVGPMSVGLNTPNGVFRVVNGRQLTVSAAIQNGPAGAAGLTLQGGGTVNFSAANSYSGGTTINDATLIVTGQTGGASGTGSGAVAVNNSGTLAGTGRVGGAVTANSGGAISPGVSAVGTLTLGGNVTFQSGGTFAAQLGASGNSDRLTIDSAAAILDFKAGSVLALSPVTGFTNAAAAGYTLASLPAGAGNNILNNGVATADGAVLGTYVQGTGASGTVVIQPSGFSLSPGDSFTLVRSGNSVALNFTPVPEPATALGLAAAGLGLTAWRRRVRTGKPVL